MTQTATVNYHVHKPERQAFELDAGGIVGNLIAPELAPTQVAVTDVRRQQAATRLEEACVAFALSPTTVNSFDDSSSWQPTYDHELTNLLVDQIGPVAAIGF